MGDETIPSNGELDTKEAKYFVDALNHSAERVQTLWFSFLTFMLYLAVATGTTTHRMLFLEEQLNLPVLNIKLPLLGFYVLTPVIFVVFHFYMLLNLVLLARTAKSFEDALVRAFPKDGEARENFRMRIENTLFVQLLVGGRLEREGLNAKLLSTVALITLALAPVALLLMIQIKFLPYHSEWITWLHRGLLALDLALVWTLWPGYRIRWGVRLWPKWRWWLVPAGVLSAAALAYAVVVATFPDERMYVATNWLHGATYFDSTTGQLSSLDRPNWHAWITWPNTLDVHGEDLIDDEKLKKNVEKYEGSTNVQRWVATLLLAGRDLTGADLSHADVRHVDLSGVILNRANLSYAWAENAHFDCIEYRERQPGCAQLQGASLDHAQLQGASLGVSLKGAHLAAAQLQGARLLYAQLQGASLDGAQLQCAELGGAQLQGASLDGAQLQGASLINANLEGASLIRVCAWRADARKANFMDTRVEHTQTVAKADKVADKVQECDWTAASFAALKQHIVAEVPEGKNKRDAMKRIEQRLDPDPTKAPKDENELAKDWDEHANSSPAPEAYETRLAWQWSELGCDADSAPYVLHALIVRLSGYYPPFRDDSDQPKALVQNFLDKDCHGARGLSEDDKARLKKLAPQAPKP
jgi:uncharacterized protein YjbI with pentapeptide repeats